MFRPERLVEEALMTAIAFGSRPLVELVLQLFYEYPAEERTGCCFSCDYPPHLTPLMLSCILNNFSLVECLLLRGHTLKPPHHLGCFCCDCSRVSSSSGEFHRRIDVYKALSSEAFLWLGTCDPFIAAYELVVDLEKEILDDNLMFIDIYKQLLENVQHFLLSLADHCWTSNEVDTFLSQRSLCTRAACHTAYPRLQTAIDSKLKNFIGSSKVQEAVENLWWNGWGDFGINTMRDIGRLIRHFVLFPLSSLLFIFTNGEIGDSFRVPLARFVSYFSSYLSFLACIVIVRISQSDNSRFQRDFRNNHWIFAAQIYMFLYVTGMVIDRYLELFRRGMKSYFSLWWRWFDFLLLGSFLLAAHSWISSVFLGPEQSRLLKNLNRRHWPPRDVLSTYDVFLSIGCILAFWRLFYFLQLLKGLGGTIVSIGKCIYNVYSYLIVIVIIIFSFAFGMTLLMGPFHDNIAKDSEGKLMKQNPQFGSIFAAIRDLYWSIYGYLDPSTTNDIVVGNAGPDQRLIRSPIISMAAEFLDAFFHMILIITLLNLMISLLVRKADEVLENEDKEFKFVRVCIYSEFMQSTSSVPPPLNLLHLIFLLISNIRSGKFNFNFPNFMQRKDVAEPDMLLVDVEREVYESLLCLIFRRYRSLRDSRLAGLLEQSSEKDRRANIPSAKFAYMNV